MTQRVLRTRVRVTGGDGMPVALRAGTVVPEEYADQITNPRCYVDTTSLEQPAEPAAPPKAEEPEDEPDETEEPDAGQEPADEPEDEKEPEGEAEPEADYSDLTVAELTDLLEQRSLPQSGTKRELIARLKADDAK